MPATDSGTGSLALDDASLGAASVSSSVGEMGEPQGRTSPTVEDLEKSGVSESKGPVPPPGNNNPQGNSGRQPSLTGQTYINHLTWREAGATSAIGGNTPSLYTLSIYLLYTLSQYTFPIHPLNSPSLYTLKLLSLLHILYLISTSGADPEELAMLKRALREEAEKSEELRRALSGETILLPSVLSLHMNLHMNPCYNFFSQYSLKKLMSPPFALTY